MLLVKGWLFLLSADGIAAQGQRRRRDTAASRERFRTASRRRGPAALVLACGLLGWAAQGNDTSLAAELATTDRRHSTSAPRPALRPFDARLNLPPPAPPNALPSSNLLYQRDDLGFSDLPYDRSLSRLCREGRFLQVRDRLFIARLGGQIYGAVVGGHWALWDPKGAALPGFIYAMHRQHTGRCEVRRISPLAGQ